MKSRVIKISQDMLSSEDWKETIFSEQIEVNPKRQLRKGKIAKYVRMADLEPFQRKIETVSHRKFRGGSRFKNGDTLLARITPCLENGKTAFVDVLEEGEIGFGSTEFIVLSAKTGKTDPLYVYYLARSPIIRKTAIKSMTGTSGRQRVKNAVFDRITINLPPLIEQKMISKILSSLDSKIEVNQQMNRTLEAVGEAVFRRWFVDFEFPDKEGKPYKSSGGKMVYNDELEKEIPKGWVTKNIGELAKINEQSITKDFKYSEIEYVDVSSVNQGCITARQILKLDTAPSRAKRIVKNNDIIVSSVRPNLKHYAIVQGAKPNTIVSTGFVVISPKWGNSKFLYYSLTSEKYTNFLTAIADTHTSTYPAFNPDVIENSLVEYPFENEQHKIPNNIISEFELIVSKLFDKIQKNNEQISTLLEMRDLLLPKLMSGKIRVPIIEDNVGVC